MNSEVDEIDYDDLMAAGDLFDIMHSKQKGMFTKPQSGEMNGTSFFDDEVIASVAELTKAFGEPTYNGNDGKGKTNFEWELKTPGGIVFTIYDWKEYRSLEVGEDVVWHIGAHDRRNSNKAWGEVVKALNNFK